MASSRPSIPITPLARPTTLHGLAGRWERLDYLFSFTGALYTQHANRADVVIEQWTPGRDMSDHYGIQASIDTTVELFPLEAAVPTLEISLRRFTCLQTTSGPGDDEATFTLSGTRFAVRCGNSARWRSRTSLRALSTILPSRHCVCPIPAMSSP